MTIDPAPPAQQLTGPAVRVDIAALRAWLTEPTCGVTRAEDLGIDECFDLRCGQLLAMLCDLLAVVTDDDTHTIWQLQPGVRDIGLARISDGETITGAMVLVDLVDGVRLASSRHDARDFTTSDSQGGQAATEAMTSLAIIANSVHAHYQTQCRATGTQPRPASPPPPL